MNSNIDQLIDNLIPRGGEKPESIHISFEDYLSRLSNFNRKLQGVKYRINCWDELCKKYKEELDIMTKSKKLEQQVIENSTGRNMTMTFSTRDVRIENEFETLLYTVTSMLSSLTRVIACFLKGSTQIHSHSKLSDVLLKHEEFEQLRLIVNQATDTWSGEITSRRDAATHYIALGITSSIVHSKTKELPLKSNIIQIGITKTPTKYLSLWEDQLPTREGSEYIAVFGDNYELHKLRDSKENIIVSRDSPLPTKPELIDGEIYIQELHVSLNLYIEDILSCLIAKL